MLKKWEFRLLSALTLVAVLLVVSNIVLFTSNRNVQTEIAGRQDYIQRSVQLEGLYREMIKALADLSVRNQDQELKNLLAAQGISVTLNAPAPPAAAPAPAAGARK